MVPGRVFLRKLHKSDKQGKIKPHHHIGISKENKLDLLVWKHFLEFPDVYNRPFLDHGELRADQIDMYLDSSRNFRLGFGAFCQNEWTYGQWNADFLNRAQPSIEYLELFAVTIAVLNWIKKFKNKRVILFCDNESVMYMLYNTTSSCPNCMHLLRIIVLEGLIHNVRIFARHVRSKSNQKADALSCLNIPRFRKCGGDKMDALPTRIPQVVWPLEKIWLYC